jgi:Xaa-Pro dipeptidase
LTTAAQAPASTLPQEIEQEIETKHGRLAELMDQNGWSAVVLRRHENLAWATAGRVEARVALGTETAVCSLLITRTGRRYYIAPNNEAARLQDEEFAGLRCEAAIYPWTDGTAAWDLARTLGGPEIASDTSQAGFHPVNLTGLRTPLLPTEVERYHALGADVAAATQRVLMELEPGISEDEMAAHISADLLAQHITPTVLLMATDERIFRYKHAVPRNGILRNYGMLNLCGRRQGLVISITRFVHFGAMPEELAANFERSARINAALLHATRKGATSAELYRAAEQAYAKEGVAEEIAQHHQGGAAGYSERDWVATPTGTERVQAVQGFAWNPSVRGAKAEDTVLLNDGQIENLTETAELPAIDVEVEGRVYRSAGVLVREA